MAAAQGGAGDSTKVAEVDDGEAAAARSFLYTDPSGARTPVLISEPLCGSEGGALVGTTATHATVWESALVLAHLLATRPKSTGSVKDGGARLPAHIDGCDGGGATVAPAATSKHGLGVSVAVAGKRVLELGSGCGLVGLVAARVGGATHVTLSEGAEAALPTLVHNARLNATAPTEQRSAAAVRADDLELRAGSDRCKTAEPGASPVPLALQPLVINGCSVTLRKLDWADEGTLVPDGDAQLWDVVLGSDLLYTEDTGRTLAGALARLLRPPLSPHGHRAADELPTAYLVTPEGRGGVAPFLASAEAVGLKVASQVVDTSTVDVCIDGLPGEAAKALFSRLLWDTFRLLIVTSA